MKTPRIRHFSFALLATSMAVACSSAPAEDDAGGEDSSEALTTAGSLVGSYARPQGSTDPIRGFIVRDQGPGKSKLFVLDLDPSVVSGVCDPVFPDQCVASRLEGTLTLAKGKASAGSFTLKPENPNTVANAAMAYLGRYTFTRTGTTLALHVGPHSQSLNVASKGKDYCLFTTDCPRADQCAEASCDNFTCGSNVRPGCDPTVETVEGQITGIDGAWKINGTPPPRAYVTLQINPTNAVSGTFTGQHSPTGPTVAGSYELGPPNAMIGLAPWTFHETGGPELNLFVGGIRHDAAGKLIGILGSGSHATDTFEYVRP